MAMLDLPLDLLENILSRVSNKSLREWRLTCKLCNTLFKDRGFIKQRFHKATREVIVMMNSKLYSLTNIDLNGGNKNTMIGLSKLHGNLYTDRNHINNISDMFHCDGLLLFRGANNMLMVWNPCSEQMKLIRQVNSASGILAFGYNNRLCDSYKVLSINTFIHSKKASIGLDIYEFSSESWRALDDVTLGCFIQSRGVSLNGNTYWIASKVIEGFLLLCFDFTTERFERLNLPSQQVLGYEILALSVFRDDQLSILLQNWNTLKVEIWVTTVDKIVQTKVLSWTKLLAVDLKTYCDHKFTREVSFFMDEEKKVLVCWDKGSMYIFGEDRDHGNFNFSVYEFSKPFYQSALFQGWFKFNLKTKDITMYHIPSNPQSRMQMRKE